MKKIKYTRSPLPFQGQKRNFREFLEIALADFNDDAVFLDLFGGSGLLSRFIKDMKPKARVIYNDFDNFSSRLKNIKTTNEIIKDIRDIFADRYKKDERISNDDKERVLRLIKSYEKSGVVVDYITLSTVLTFSGKCHGDFNSLSKTPFYKTTLPIYDEEKAAAYFNGLEIKSACYTNILKEFKEYKNVVLVCDPPYLQTDMSQYNLKNRWGLYEFLTLFNELTRPFIFFSSTRSEFGVFVEKMKTHNISQYLKKAKKLSKKVIISKNATYVDELYWSA